MVIASKRLLLAAGIALQMTVITSSQEPKTAIATMLEPGPEAHMLAGRTGSWTAKVTVWPSPGAVPVVLENLAVRREMVGTILQETISKEGSGAFKRIDYLDFNRIESRWQYVSMDTRFPVGLMPASGEVSSTPDRITLQFQPFAFPGWNGNVDGWLLRMSAEITGIGTDHELTRQYWIRSDGSGQRWLAIEYDYRRAAK